jgi:hypothetical protein
MEALAVELLSGCTRELNPKFQSQLRMELVTRKLWGLVRRAMKEGMKVKVKVKAELKVGLYT